MVMPMTSKSSTTTTVKLFRAVHPGEVLREEMEARDISGNRLALALRVPSGRITQILNGKRSITAETAMRLGHYFGNGARFWLDLQTHHDLTVAENAHGKRIAAEVERAA